jgi:hypothetical protein
MGFVGDLDSFFLLWHYKVGKIIENQVRISYRQPFSKI